VKCLHPSGIWLSVTILVGLPSVAECVTLNQVDLFQGSKDSWTDGHGGVNGTVVATGGPNGAGDSYLQFSSGTLGGESKLITFNQAQWTGNYIAAGVGAVSMSLKNFGTTTLPIRITLRDATGGSNVGGYSSRNAFMLPADGQWHSARFLLDTADMSAVGTGLPPLSMELTAVKDFRLLVAAQPSITGSTISGRIGVDDITAQRSVPEPSALALLAIGGAALIARGARKCRL
jgi:hypothetical protein